MIREQFLKNMTVEICRHQDLSEEFVRENAEQLSWVHISKYQKLSLNFIREFKDFIDWKAICQNDKIKFDIDFIREFEDKLSWNDISEQSVFIGNEEHIEEFNTKINYTALRANINYYTPQLLDRFSEKFHWITIDPNWYNEKFVDKHSYHLRMNAISSISNSGKPRYWKEWFIKKYNNYFDFCSLAVNQELSEEFLREFADKLNWSIVCRHQRLSKEFLREFEDQIHWDMILFNPKENYIARTGEFRDKFDKVVEKGYL